MKLKLMSILAGAAVCIIPFISIAARAQSERMPEMPPLPPGVEFTQQQKTQMQQIRAQTRAQMDAIVTPEQRDRFKSAMERGETFQSARAAMNLSLEQQAKLKAVIESSRSQTENLLTPEQRRQIFQLMRSHLMPD